MVIIYGMYIDNYVSWPCEQTIKKWLFVIVTPTNAGDCVYLQVRTYLHTSVCIRTYVHKII